VINQGTRTEIWYYVDGVGVKVRHIVRCYVMTCGGIVQQYMRLWQFTGTTWDWVCSENPVLRKKKWWIVKFMGLTDVIEIPLLAFVNTKLFLRTFVTPLTHLHANVN
jgi:hypothetical protein